MFLPPPDSIPWPAPLLNSPLAFVVLALIVGIAVYLRIAAESTNRQIYDILEGKGAVTSYAASQDYIAKRIEGLDRTRRWSERLALWLFMPLAVATALRIIAHAISLVSLRMYYRLDMLNPWLRAVDLAITVGLFASLSLLWGLYLSSARGEDQVRAKAFNSYNEASGSDLESSRPPRVTTDPGGFSNARQNI